MLETARAAFTGASRMPLSRVVVLRALLARATHDELDPGYVPAAVYMEIANLIEPWAMIWPHPAPLTWDVAASRVAEGWDPLGLGKVPIEAWKTLLADYLAAPSPRHVRGVRKRGIRDRDDVVFKFLGDHGLTQASTAKNLRDAVANISRPRKQTR